jgi:transcription elongation factor Elf1
MNHFIQKMQKYSFLIPNKDIHRLCQSDIEVLDYLVNKIDELRKSDGKPPLSKNKYIICNQDEPYAEEVWQIILEGERKKLLNQNETVRLNANHELEFIMSQFPCPCCKSNEIFLEPCYIHVPQLNNHKANRYFAICSGCGLSTESVPSQIKAVELWCTRDGIKPDIENMLKTIEKLDKK